MTTKEITLRAAAEVTDTLSRMEEAQGQALVDAILEAPRVFVAGAGRAGNLMRGFGMRMMHMDLRSFVVGESVTPGIAAGDLLVIGSGSGETGSLVHMAQKAKGLGARVALITTAPASLVGRIAHVVVEIPTISKLVEHRSVPSFQPMANLFEQCLMFFVDSVTMVLMERLGTTSDEMYRNHANLE